MMLILMMTVVMNVNVLAAPGDASAELKQTQDNKKELQSKVQDMNKEIEDVIKKVDSNKKDMNKVAEDIKNTQAKLESIEKDSKTQEDLFRKRARAMYMNGMDGYFQVVLESRSLSDLMSRIDMVERVMEFDKNTIAKVKEQRELVARQKQNLDNENSKLLALKESNEGVLLKLNADIKQQQELLAKTTEKENQLIAAEKEREQAANEAKLLASNNGTSTASRGSSGQLSFSKMICMDSTAYSGDRFTSSGTRPKRDTNGYSTIAVDPWVIPLGTRVFVDGYGYAVAEDIGGDIKGNRIDVFFTSESEANSWGRRSVNVYILN